MNFTFEYDMTLDEAIAAFAVFERKYCRVKWTISLVLYAGLFSFALFLQVNSGWRNVIYYIIMVIAVFAAYQVWNQPNLTRRRIRQTWETAPDETYRAEFSEYGVNIVTIVKTEGGHKEVPQFIKSDEQQFFTEKDDLLIFIVNKALTYTFPKRCIGAETQQTVREYFQKVLTDYV